MDKTVATPEGDIAMHYLRPDKLVYQSETKIHCDNCSGEQIILSLCSK